MIRRQAENVWFRSPATSTRCTLRADGRAGPAATTWWTSPGSAPSRPHLCADGRIRTDTQGRSWQTVHKRSRVFSINADDEGLSRRHPAPLLRCRR